MAQHRVETMVDFWNVVIQPTTFTPDSFQILVKELGLAYLSQAEIEKYFFIVDEANLYYNANLPEAADSVYKRGVAYLLLTRSRDGKFIQMLGTLTILKKVETTPKPKQNLLGGN